MSWLVMPDLQSGVIETRICNPHHAAWRIIINYISGCCGLQIQRKRAAGEFRGYSMAYKGLSMEDM